MAVGDVLDRISGKNTVLRIRLNSQNIDVTENVSKKAENRRFWLDCDDTSINGTEESTLW